MNTDKATAWSIDCGHRECPLQGVSPVSRRPSYCSTSRRSYDRINVHPHTRQESDPSLLHMIFGGHFWRVSPKSVFQEAPNIEHTLSAYRLHQSYEVVDATGEEGKQGAIARAHKSCL